MKACEVLNEEAIQYFRYRGAPVGVPGNGVPGHILVECHPRRMCSRTKPMGIGDRISAR